MTTNSRQKRIALGQAIRENRTYFLAYFLLLTLGCFLLVRIPVGNENLYFVQFRGSIWDEIFKITTKLAEPLVIVPIILLSLFISFRKTVSILAVIAITMIITSLAKTFFYHPRPVLYFHQLDRLAELIPVDGAPLLTGHSSFPSGHTMAAFSIFTLLALQSKHKGGIGALFLLLATAVGLSRIYLGQHFLKDAIAGSIFGVTIALVLFVLFERLAHHPKWNRNILTLFKHK